MPRRRRVRRCGITAIVTDSIINEGFESLTEVLGGRPVNFVVLRPPVAVLRQRGIDRLPEEAAYLADRYGDCDHPEAAEFAGGSRPQPTAGRSTSLRRSSNGASIACRTSDFGLIPVAWIRESVVDLLLDRRAEAAWMAGAGTNERH